MGRNGSKTGQNGSKTGKKRSKQPRNGKKWSKNDQKPKKGQKSIKTASKQSQKSLKHGFPHIFTTFLEQDFSNIDTLFKPRHSNQIFTFTHFSFISVSIWKSDSTRRPSTIIRTSVFLGGESRSKSKIRFNDFLDATRLRPRRLRSGRRHVPKKT